LSFITTFPDPLRVSKHMIYLNILYYTLNPLWVLASYTNFRTVRRREEIYKETNLVRIKCFKVLKGSKTYHFRRRNSII